MAIRIFQNKRLGAQALERIEEWAIHRLYIGSLVIWPKPLA